MAILDIYPGLANTVDKQYHALRLVHHVDYDGWDPPYPLALACSSFEQENQNLLMPS